MSINQKKTQFMVINKSEKDKDCESIVSRGINVKYCDSYIYLGAPITDNGSYLKMINAHAKDKMKHSIKYYAFLDRNPDVPFSMKKRVAEACVLSSLLYGAETWFTDSFGKAETMYNKVVKALLDVRNTTCTDVCLVEADMASFQSLVKHRMKKYLQKKIPKIDSEYPLWKAIELCRSADTASFRFIQRVLDDETEVIKEDKSSRVESLTASESTKRMTYVSLNPTIQQHKVYKNDCLQEHKRKEFTRYRVSSHNLKVETGRWGRIERDNRVCICATGGIQDEEHVIFYCEMTKNVREKFNIQSDSLPALYEEKDDETLCNIFFELSKIFAK